MLQQITWFLIHWAQADIGRAKDEGMIILRQNMAVHLFFLIRLFGMQYLQPTLFLAKDGPFFTTMQFVFFFVWLKFQKH